MSSDEMLAPRKTKLIKSPPSRAGKDVKCPGYARGGGGMLKLRFDWYIIPSWTEDIRCLCTLTDIQVL